MVIGLLWVSLQRFTSEAAGTPGRGGTLRAWTEAQPDCPPLRCSAAAVTLLLPSTHRLLKVKMRLHAYK